MKNSVVSVGEVFSFAWGEFKKNPWFYIGVTFLLLLVSSLVSALTSGPHGQTTILGFLISYVVSVVIAIAFARLALAASAGEKVGWGALWAPEHFLNMLGASIIQGVIIVVGFVLLVIPGIIASLLLMFTQLSVVDKKMNPFEAIKNSYYLAKSHLFDLFILFLALLVLNFVGLVALVVGLFVTVPLTVIAVAHVYRTLSQAQEPMVSVSNETPQ